MISLRGWRWLISLRGWRWASPLSSGGVGGGCSGRASPLKLCLKLSLKFFVSPRAYNYKYNFKHNFERSDQTHLTGGEKNYENFGNFFPVLFCPSTAEMSQIGTRNALQEVNNKKKTIIKRALFTLLSSIMCRTLNFAGDFPLPVAVN